MWDKLLLARILSECKVTPFAINKKIPVSHDLRLCYRQYFFPFSHLFVEPPAILTPPANVRVNEGGTVSFTCVARGNPRPTFTWMRNTTTLSSQITTTPVTNLAGVNQRGSLAVTSTLNIPSSQFNGDQGTYTCTASNTHGNAPASPATLKVFGKYGMIRNRRYCGVAEKGDTFT